MTMDRLRFNLLDAVRQSYLVIDPQLFIRDANAAYLEMTGTSRADIIDKHAFDAFPENPEDTGAHGKDRIMHSIRHVLDTGAAHDLGVVKYDIPDRHDPKGRYQERFWNVSHRPIFDDGNLVAVVQAVEDVTESHIGKRDSTIKLRIAAGINGIGYGEFDFRTRRSSVSDELVEMFGLEEGDDPEDSATYFDRVHPDDLNAVNTALEKAIADESEMNIDYRIVLPDGAVKWINTRGEILFDQGVPMRFIGASIDFTVSKQREDDLRDALIERDRLLVLKEELLGDVNHRVKNSMQLVSSILRIEAATAQEDRVRAHLDRAKMRVQAISSVHDLIYRTHQVSHVEMGDYLPQLADAIGESLGAGKHGVQIATRAAPVRLPTDTAISLAVLVNELLTDTINAAIDAGEQGPIETVVSASKGRLTLTVAAGRAMQEAETQEAGHHSIVDGMVGQIGGTMTTDTVENGYQVTVTAPLPT